MCKQAQILANLDKKFDDSYALAFRSIQLTKPDFSMDNMKTYEFLSPFNFNGIIMVYLLAEVEKLFGIKIASVYFNNYAFTTIDSIVDIIYKTCQEDS